MTPHVDWFLFDQLKFAIWNGHLERLSNSVLPSVLSCARWINFQLYKKTLTPYLPSWSLSLYHYHVIIIRSHIIIVCSYISYYIFHIIIMSLSLLWLFRSHQPFQSPVYKYQVYHSRSYFSFKTFFLRWWLSLSCCCARTNNVYRGLYQGQGFTSTSHLS